MPKHLCWIMALLGMHRGAFHVPILIENRALGYRIEFFIEEFRIEDYSPQYRAKTRFEELTPRDGKNATDDAGRSAAIRLGHGSQISEATQVPQLS